MDRDKLLMIEDNKIYYESLHKYKYRLTEDYSFDIGIKGYTYLSPYLDLYKNGLCVLKKGYCSDGPSGPTIDTKTFMRGAFEHDGGYQLIRLGIIPVSFRKHLDKKLRETYIKDSKIIYNTENKKCRKRLKAKIMRRFHKFRAWYIYHSVKIGGAGSAKPGTQKIKVYSAP